MPPTAMSMVLDGLEFMLALHGVMEAFSTLTPCQGQCLDLTMIGSFSISMCSIQWESLHDTAMAIAR